MSQPPISVTQMNVGAGVIVQTVFGQIAPINGITVIPFDNSSPLITEGTELGAAPITRVNSTSSVQINFSLTLDSSAINNDIVVAVFRNDVCVASSIITIDTSGNPKTMTITFVDETPGSGSPAFADPITYSGRIGNATGAATWYANSTSSGNDMGGTLETSFVLHEIY